MTFNKDDYEIVEWTTKETNKSVTKKGFRIGEYLAVGYGKDDYHYRIYNIKSGKALLKGDFDKVEDAVNTAEYLDSHYAKYFAIWDKFPNMDIFSIVKWTIKDGLRLYEMIEILRQKRELSAKCVNDAFHEAETRTGKWSALGG